jgi:cytochrome c556
MKKRSFSSLMAVLVFLTAAVVATNGQVKKGKTRPLTTEQLMEAIVKPHMTALKKGLIDAKPASDDDWKHLALSVSLLNESSFIMMEDGRCPDQVWADACVKDLREGSAMAAEAIAKRDVEAALAGVKKLGASCKACHTKHKE